MCITKCDDWVFTYVKAKRLTTNRLWERFPGPVVRKLRKSNREAINEYGQPPGAQKGANGLLNFEIKLFFHS